MNFRREVNDQEAVHALKEEILKENPSVCEYMAPSLDARQDSQGHQGMGPAQVQNNTSGVLHNQRRRHAGS